MKAATPEYCTFACKHSDFPPAETAGLCRTMAAVYCRKLRRLVNKNGPCVWRAEQGKVGAGRKGHASGALRRQGGKRLS